MTSPQYIPGISQPGYFQRFASLVWNSEFVQSLRELGLECLIALFDKLDQATRRRTAMFAFPTLQQAQEYAASVLAQAGFTEADNVLAGFPTRAARPSCYTPFHEPVERYYFLPTVVVPRCGGNTVFGKLVVDAETLQFAGIQTQEGLVTAAMLRE